MLVSSVWLVGSVKSTQVKDHNFRIKRSMSPMIVCHRNCCIGSGPRRYAIVARSKHASEMVNRASKNKKERENRRQGKRKEWGDTNNGRGPGGEIGERHGHIFLIIKKCFFTYFLYYIYSCMVFCICGFGLGQTIYKHIFTILSQRIQHNLQTNKMVSDFECWKNNYTINRTTWIITYTLKCNNKHS